MAAQEPVRHFRAFDLTGKYSHIISNVERIDSQRLRPGEWPHIKSRAIVALDLSEDELAEREITSKRHEISCEYCFRLGSDPDCGPACYTAFQKENFSHPQAEIRGPGPLGYAAFVRPGVTINKGQWVGEYIGELRPIRRVNRELAIGKQSMYRFDFPVEKGIVVVDSERRGNWTRFINSSCKSNLDVWASFVGKRHVLLLQANRDILAGEELFFYYGKRYFDAADIHCGCEAVGFPHVPGLRVKRPLKPLRVVDVGEKK